MVEILHKSLKAETRRVAHFVFSDAPQGKEISVDIRRTARHDFLDDGNEIRMNYLVLIESTIFGTFCGDRDPGNFFIFREPEGSGGEGTELEDT